MPEKFQNKYTTKSTRLKNHNYTQNGLYFVTICTQDKEYFFGEIKNGEMVLNDIGKIAHQFWQEIPQHFPFVNLDQFVVMPDHVHGILEINKNALNECTRRDEALPRLENNQHQSANNKCQDAILQHQDAICQHQDAIWQHQDAIWQHQDIIKNQDVDSIRYQDEALPRLYMGEYPQMSEISPKPCSLSVIIGAYKSIVSKIANKQFPIGFHWQPRFFDHIIRNDETLNKIREYINKNPARWERDQNGLENLWM